MPTTPPCPKCNNTDRIQALPALHLNRMRPVSIYGPEGDLQTVNMTTELFQLLAPPPEPRTPSGAGCVPVAAMLVVLFVLIIVTFCGLMLTVSNGMALFRGQDLAAGLPQEFEPGMFTAALGLVAVFGIVLMVLGSVGTVFMFRQINRVSKSARETAEIRYAIQKPIYDRAKLWWDNCYYCHIHGIVFDGSNLWHPQQFRKILDNIYRDSQA